jgi:hypothetical protein|tara:strand:- start:230 stop:1171 length:942 start_codon:yes stop_codon:yes gene_type:complete
MHERDINHESIGKKLLLNSFLPIEELYPKSSINNFNNKFDPLFSEQSNPRRYVDSLDIYNLGLIEEVFTPKLLSLIYDIIPDPILYHCHSYEIDGFNSKSHIANDNFLNGWHRDIDCIHDLDRVEIQHVSLFIYLTDVGDGDGAFQICNKQLRYLPRLFRSSKFYSVMGNKGCSFLFNRTATHRASPNRNSTNRRVLKISFQSKNTPSHKLSSNILSHDKHFKLVEVCKLIPESNILLRSLFGDKKVDNREISLAINELKSNTNIPRVNSLNTYQINIKMLPMEEFRGYIRDCFYISKLVIYKIKQALRNYNS